MQKQAWTWTTPRFPMPARLVRWGHFGVPVLIFPSAGGDFEEIERFQLVPSLGSLIDGGRIKVYSVDALAVHARLSGTGRVDDSFDTFLYEDVLQRIRSDCKDPHIEPILVGASLGAATAVSTLCRHPDSFRAVVGLSGVYRSEVCSDPMIEEIGALTASRIEQLKSRTISLVTGAGHYEDPTESQRLAAALGAKGIPCRFKDWGLTHDHSWANWREQLPGVLGDLL